MKKTEMLLALLTSVGIGAATYYSMSKKDGSFANSIENYAPMLMNLNNENEGKLADENNEDNTGLLGDHGMS